MGEERGLMGVLEYMGELVRGITEARSVIGELAVNTSISEQFNACCKNKEERLTKRKFFLGEVP